MAKKKNLVPHQPNNPAATGKTIKIEPVQLAWTVQLLLSCFALALVTFYVSQRLPSVSLETTDLSQFSEIRARDTVRALEGHGIHFPGTIQQQEALDYLEQLTKDITSSNTNAFIHDIQVDIESVTGSHQIVFSNHTNIKTYTGIQNLVVSLSCGPECDQNALLAAAHYDSGILSPGAADNGVNVAVLIDVLRVLTSNQVPLRNKLVLVFNGAEESLLDGMHGFLSQSKHASNIRSFINLDAMGSAGRAIVFQVNSLDMVSHYAKSASHPHINVVSNDLFRADAIPSTTDYHHLAQQPNITGLDMALYENSYVYHTLLDQERFVQKGSIQHIGNNVLVLIKRLLQEPIEDTKVTEDLFVFFDVLGLFVVRYNWITAYVLHYGAALAGLLSVMAPVSFTLTKNNRIKWSWTSPTIKSCWYLALGLLEYALMLTSAVVGPCTIMLMVSSAFGKQAAFFNSSLQAVVLCGPAALLGLVYGHLGLRSIMNRSDLPQFKLMSFERRLYRAHVAFWAILTAYMTSNEIASAYLPALVTVTSLAGWSFRPNSQDKNVPVAMQLPPVAYYLTSLIPFTLMLDLFAALIAVFVPLTGRMGVRVPADTIIASMVGVFAFAFVAHLMPLLYRLNDTRMTKLMGVLALSAILSTSYNLLFVPVHDALHPQRIPVQYTYNATSKEHHLHVAQISSVSNTPVVKAVESWVDSTAEKRTMNETIVDWGVFEFFGRHASNARLAVPEDKQIHFVDDVEIKVQSDLIWGDKRNVTLLVRHPHHLMTGLEFYAKMSWWSLDVPLPKNADKEVMRYHVRNINGYSEEPHEWQLSLYFDVGDSKALSRGDLWIQFRGIEKYVFEELNTVPPETRGSWNDEWADADFWNGLQQVLPESTTPMFVKTFEKRIRV